jgi:hypothetical protein
MNGSWTDRIRKWAAAAALIAIVVGAVGVATFLIVAANSRDDAFTAAPSSSFAPPPPPVPTVGEFTVGVAVSRQDCDPTGRCLYTYTIEPRYIGVRPLPERELRVGYRVTGGHQPQDGYFTVTGRDARFLRDVTVEGPPNATLRAAVIEVVEKPAFGPPVSAVPGQP